MAFNMKENINWKSISWKSHVRACTEKPVALERLRDPVPQISIRSLSTLSQPPIQPEKIYQNWFLNFRQTLYYLNWHINSVLIADNMKIWSIIIYPSLWISISISLISMASIFQETEVQKVYYANHFSNIGYTCYRLE